jgi:hypothetical protein
MDTLLLAWTSDAPMFTMIEPVDGRWTLGREHPAWPTPDEWMSRIHCEVERTPTGWGFRDLGSANGSRLDGHSFATRVERKHWGVLQLGHSLLVRCPSRVVRLDIAHPTFAARDWDDLEEAARPMVGRRGRVAIPWLMHHAARMTAPLALDILLVSVFLLRRWIDARELIGAVRATVGRAVAAGAPVCSSTTFLSTSGAHATSVRPGACSRRSATGRGSLVSTFALYRLRAMSTSIGANPGGSAASAVFVGL